MSCPSDCIEVVHGSMTVCVPKKIFRGPEAQIDEGYANEFRGHIRTRYSWLSDNAVDVILRNGRKEMLRRIDEESNGRIPIKQMASKGKNDEAITRLKRHLEDDPNDADSWYMLGELLCKCGKVEEGYRALNKGRSLIGK